MGKFLFKNHSILYVLIVHLDAVLWVQPASAQSSSTLRGVFPPYNALEELPRTRQMFARFVAMKWPSFNF